MEGRVDHRPRPGDGRDDLLSRHGPLENHPVLKAPPSDCSLQPPPIGALAVDVKLRIGSTHVPPGGDRQEWPFPADESSRVHHGPRGPTLDRARLHGAQETVRKDPGRDGRGPGSLRILSQHNRCRSHGASRATDPVESGSQDPAPNFSDDARGTERGPHASRRDRTTSDGPHHQRRAGSGDTHSSPVRGERRMVRHIETHLVLELRHEITDGALPEVVVQDDAQPAERPLDPQYRLAEIVTDHMDPLPLLRSECTFHAGDVVLSGDEPDLVFPCRGSDDLEPDLRLGPHVGGTGIGGDQDTHATTLRAIADTISPMLLSASVRATTTSGAGQPSREEPQLTNTPALRRTGATSRRYQEHLAIRLGKSPAPDAARKAPNLRAASLAMPCSSTWAQNPTGLRILWTARPR